MASRPKSELRILAFAGLRLDASFPWSTPEAGQAARAGRQLALQAICAIAASEADVLVCAGDLYEEERHHPDTGEVLREGFELLAPTPVVLVPGETDPGGKSSLYQRVTWPDNVHVLGIEYEPEALEVVKGLTIWGTASPEGFDGFTAPGSGIHVGLTHWPAPLDVERSGLHHLVSGAEPEPSTSGRVTHPGAAQPPDPDAPQGSAAFISVFDDGSVTTGWRELAGEAPAPPRHRFSTADLHGFDLALLGEEQTVRGEFVRDLLGTVELGDPHVRRLALLSGLRALGGVKPLMGSQSAEERNGG